MLATMPGRTQGLGLITEPLLKDLHIDRITYANINLWATLIGAVFCFPAGYLIDRFGLRLEQLRVAGVEKQSHRAAVAWRQFHQKIQNPPDVVFGTA